MLGMAFHNTIGTPLNFKPGVVFSMRRILQFAIILLGLQLSLSQVVSVGLAGIAQTVLKRGLRRRWQYQSANKMSW